MAVEAAFLERLRIMELLFLKAGTVLSDTKTVRDYNIAAGDGIIVHGIGVTDDASAQPAATLAAGGGAAAAAVLGRNRNADAASAAAGTQGGEQAAGREVQQAAAPRVQAVVEEPRLRAQRRRGGVPL